MRDVKSEEASSKEITDANIGTVDTELAAAVEKRKAHIYEKMRLLSLQYEMLSQQLPAAFRSTMGRKLSDINASLPAHRELEYYRDLTENSDKISAAVMLREIYRGTDTPLDYIGQSNESTLASSIIYFKNASSDTAYVRFSAVLPGATVSYAQDFSSACEEVYYERARYCIIPVSTSADGRLAGFCRLTDKYELTVVYRCEVGDTVFALCAKYPELITAKTTKRHLEIRINHDGDRLAEILNAARFCRLDNTEIDGIPLLDGAADVLSFEGADEEICDLLYYLFCCGQRFVLTGLY